MSKYNEGSLFPHSIKKEINNFTLSSHNLDFLKFWVSVIFITIHHNFKEGKKVRNSDK